MSVGTTHQSTSLARASARARTPFRRLGWTFSLLILLLYLLHVWFDLLSLTAARVLFVLVFIAFCGACIWLDKKNVVNCSRCGFAWASMANRFRSASWRFCPGCGVSANSSSTSDASKPQCSRSGSLARAYLADVVSDTTRNRARRWQRTNVYALLCFFVFMSSLSLAFIGPWTASVAANWYWLMFAALGPIGTWMAANAIFGLRCTGCAYKFHGVSQISDIARLPEDQKRWNVCPQCQHSLDQSSNDPS